MTHLRALDGDGLRRMPRVLIAEDNDSLREALGAALQAEGLEVHLATTAEEAYRSAQAGDFDVVLSDICMPDNFDGAALVRRLSGASPGIPIVLMTGFDQPGGRESALAEGAVDYLLKPIRLERLRVALSRALERGPSTAAH
jgi:DNA-binding NtrC family response regulator